MHSLAQPCSHVLLACHVCTSHLLTTLQLYPTTLYLISDYAIPFLLSSQEVCGLVKVKHTVHDVFVRLILRDEWTLLSVGSQEQRTTHSTH